MTASIPSPMGYHRSRRDHHLRMFFSAASRVQNGKPVWARAQGGGRKEIVSILEETHYHAREVLRERLLEWPDTHPEEADRALLSMVAELQAWFALLESVAAGGDDPRSSLHPLLETRIRHGLRLFHTGRLGSLSPARLPA